MKLLTLLFVTACLGGGHWPEELSPDYQRGAKDIASVRFYQNYREWQRSGYARAADGVQSGPVYVAVAGDGTACIVSERVWALARARDFVVCTPWRVWRP